MVTRIPKSSGKAATASEKTNPLSLSDLQTVSEAKFQQLESSINQSLGAAGSADAQLQRQDAFRHAFSSAVVTRDIAQVLNQLNPGDTQVGRDIAMNSAGSATAALGRGLEAISVLDKGTERRNHEDVGMDLHNNQRGIEIAKRLGMNATNDQIAAEVATAMARGDLILSNEDPRAKANFDAQYDMAAFQKTRDGATAIADAAQSAVQSTQELVAKVADAGKSAAASASNVMESVSVTVSAYKAPEANQGVRSLEDVEKALDQINSSSPFTQSQSRSSASSMSESQTSAVSEASTSTGAFRVEIGSKESSESAQQSKQASQKEQEQSMSMSE